LKVCFFVNCFEQTIIKIKLSFFLYKTFCFLQTNLQKNLQHKDLRKLDKIFILSILLYLLYIISLVRRKIVKLILIHRWLHCTLCCNAISFLILIFILNLNFVFTDQSKIGNVKRKLNWNFLPRIMDVSIFDSLIILDSFPIF